MLQLLIQATKLSWLYDEIRESIASRNFGLQFSRKLYSAYKLNNILFISRIIVMISCGNEIETKFNLHSQQVGANGGKYVENKTNKMIVQKKARNPFANKHYRGFVRKGLFNSTFPVKSPSNPIYGFFNKLELTLRGRVAQ